VSIPKKSSPFTAKEIIDLGVRKDLSKTNNHCGKAYQYNLSLIGRITCHESTICKINESISGTYIMSLKAINQAGFIDYLSKSAQKVIITCSYSAEKETRCDSGKSSFRDNSECSLTLPVYTDQFGHLQRGKEQDQQEQQQQQFRRQNQSK
jgi:hypothetical protein